MKPITYQVQATLPWFQSLDWESDQRALPISACLASGQRWERSQENSRSAMGQVATGELSRVLDSSSSHVRAPWEGTARPHPTHVPANGQDGPSWADPVSAERVLSL